MREQKQKLAEKAAGATNQIEVSNYWDQVRMGGTYKGVQVPEFEHEFAQDVRNLANQDAAYNEWQRKNPGKGWDDYDPKTKSTGNYSTGPKSIEPLPTKPQKAPYKFYVCFDRDTLVHTLEGLLPIQHVRPESYILAYDLDTGTIAPSRVVGLDVHEGAFDLIGITGSSDDEVRVTPGHWFFDGANWVRSEQLLDSTRPLMMKGGRMLASARKCSEQKAQVVYNVRTELGTYIVGKAGFVVAGTTLEAVYSTTRDCCQEDSATGQAESRSTVVHLSCDEIVPS